MALPPVAAEWMSRAEIDYIGPFVKAWAAFNAWYRQASGASQERAMLNFVVQHQNSRVRRRGLPLLENGNVTAEATALKQAILDLHLKLDAIHFEVSRKGVMERISFRTVCIRPRDLQNELTTAYNYVYRAQRVTGGGIQITVTAPNGNVRFQHTQTQYEPTQLSALPYFTNNLSQAQRLTLQAFYDGCNPRPMHDLVQGGGPALTIATIEFQCTPAELLAGLVEVLYSMRNALLHGEVDPDEQVLACYEPSYRIVMSILRCIA